MHRPVLFLLILINLNKFLKSAQIRKHYTEGFLLQCALFLVMQGENICLYCFFSSWNMACGCVK